MNKYCITLTFGVLMVLCLPVRAQEFDKHMASARSAYQSGNLEDARFSLENALREIDATIGREILKVLPMTLSGLTADTRSDQVTGMGTSIVAGLYVHRVYGKENEPKNITLDILSDSPLMAGINAILSMPIVMNTGDGNQKVIKVQGYKALLTREADENNQTTGYQIQIPFSNSLLTVHHRGNITEAEMIKIGNALPLDKIIKLAQ